MDSRRTLCRKPRRAFHSTLDQNYNRRNRGHGQVQTPLAPLAPSSETSVVGFTIYEHPEISSVNTFQGCSLTATYRSCSLCWQSQEGSVSLCTRADLMHSVWKHVGATACGAQIQSQLVQVDARTSDKIIPASKAIPDASVRTAPLSQNLTLKQYMQH